MVNPSQIRTGIGNYLNSAIMPKLDNGRQFAVGMVYGLAGSKIEDIVRNMANMPAIKMLGVVHENGEIDIDAVYEAALNQIRAQGRLTLDVPMLGKWTFDEADIRDLYQAIAHA